MSRCLKTIFGLSAVLWIASLASIALWGVPFRLRFETNDDVFMMLIASGRYTGEPSEFLLYMNVLVGQLLKELFILFPAFNSYLVLFCAMHIFFAAAVIFVLRRMEDDGLRLTLLWAVMILFHLPVYLRLQFTTTAFVTAMGGILLAVDVAVRGGSARSVGVRYGSAVAGWFLAFLVRSQSALLALALAAPVLLYAGYVTERRARFVGLALVIALLAGGALWLQSARIDRYPEWRDFQRFNALRGRVHVAPGFSFDAGSESVYRAVGWSANDVVAFQQWFFPDPEVHAADDVSRVVDEIRRPRRGVVAVRSWLMTLREHRFKVVAAMVLTLGSVIGVGRRGVALAASGAAISIALQLYVDATARLPLRVLMPLLYGPALVLLPVWPNRPRHPRAPVVVGAWMMLCCLIVARGVFHGMRLDREHREMAEAWRTAPHDFDGSLLVLWADDWPLEWQTPGLRMEPPGNGGRYLSLSSLTRSPHNDAVLQSKGIGDLMEAMLSRDDVLLACREVRMPILRKYVEEHHRSGLDADDRGGLFSRRVWKLRRNPEGANDDG